MPPGVPAATPQGGGGADESAGVLFARNAYQSVLSGLGNATADRTSPPPTLQGWQFPFIPVGSLTTLIPVPFPVTTAGPSPAKVALQDAEIACVLGGAFLIWALPWFFINQKICCRCFQRWMSRRLTCYFMVCLLLNATFISYVIMSAPDVSANDLFFGSVKMIGAVSDKLEDVLFQLALLGCVVVALIFRKKIVALLGFDQQFIRADLRDFLTCFTMKRFGAIEVSLWKMENLPTGFSSRSLYIRVVMGYNEAQHTRPHDGCSSTLLTRERMQLNYDPEDDTQRLSIVVKAQEVVGGAVSQLAPAAGAVAGAVVNLFTPLGPGPGAAAGVVAGIGAANSLGQEVARVDLSSAMVNRLLAASRPTGTTQVPAHQSCQAEPWKSENFVKIDLVPQGFCWLRIAEVATP